VQRKLWTAADFEQRYRNRLSQLSPPAFAVMMRELETSREASARPALYAHLYTAKAKARASAKSCSIFGSVGEPIKLIELPASVLGS
jgi:hypothetical protein